MEGFIARNINGVLNSEIDLLIQDGRHSRSNYRKFVISTYMPHSILNSKITCIILLKTTVIEFRKMLVHKQPSKNGGVS